MAVTVESDAVKSGLKVIRDEAGVVLCRSAKYTNSGAKAVNSIVKMVPLPKGARVVGVAYKSTALGLGRTIDIGDATTVGKYVAGADVAAAAAAYVPQDVTLTADEDVQITVLGDTLPDAAVLSLHVFYKMAAAIADEA